jgi:hypothetical protein
VYVREAAGRLTLLAHSGTVVSMSVDVMCAFCGQDVETLGVDPCALVVVANWRASSTQQREQQFLAHAECLRSRMHPEVAAEAEVLG